jgi:ribosomal protein L28
MRQCEKCGKGSVIRGKRKLLRGHYNPTSTSRKYPNLQFAKVDGVRKLICTSCIRTISKKAYTKAGTRKANAVAAAVAA